MFHANVDSFQFEQSTASGRNKWQNQYRNQNEKWNMKMKMKANLTWVLLLLELLLLLPLFSPLFSPPSCSWLHSFIKTPTSITTTRLTSTKLLTRTLRIGKWMPRRTDWQVRKNKSWWTVIRKSFVDRDSLRGQNGMPTYHCIYPTGFGVHTVPLEPA